MSNRSGLDKALNAAQIANGIKNIVKGAIKGGIKGAAIETTKTFAPQLIKIACIVAVILILLPVIIISALPSVLFGWTSIPDQDLKDRKNYATVMTSCYNQVSSYKSDVIDEIKKEKSRDGDIVTITDNTQELDVFWLISIDGVRHKQDVYGINEREIKDLIKESLNVSVTRENKNVNITLETLSSEELMDKLGYTNDMKNWARLLYNTTTSSQTLSDTDPDYIAGIGNSYSELHFTDGISNVVYYNQLDTAWSNTMYGKSSTIGQAGCGPTSLAMVVSTLTNKKVTPVEVANWSVKNGHRCEGNGSYHSLIPKGAQYYGLSVFGVGKNDAQKIINALSEGKLIISIMNPGHFTKSGHFIVLRGVTSSGKILVADPASYSRSENEWDLSIILNEARGDAASGGPFWIIG